MKNREKYFLRATRQKGLPWWLSGKESSCNSGDAGLIPGSGRSPGGGQPIPLFLPGEFHGQRSLVGYSPWGRKESDATEATEHSTAPDRNTGS